MDEPPGLPPVAPPSGKFIVQLFMVPGLIVGLIVCILLLFNWLFGGPRSPEAFLQKLDDPNTEVRWRAAADLAAAAASIPEIERLIALKENQLSVLMGKNPGPIDTRMKLLEETIPPDIPAGLPSRNSSGNAAGGAS